jgi:hypothetical protein
MPTHVTVPKEVFRVMEILIVEYLWSSDRTKYEKGSPMDKKIRAAVSFYRDGKKAKVFHRDVLERYHRYQSGTQS